MASVISIGAASLLAQLAAADPYTALENSSILGLDDGQLFPTTAAGADHSAEQVGRQSTGSQSPASALEMLQQLIASPSSSSSDKGSSKAVIECISAGAAVGMLEPVSDLWIIGDFCSRTVSRKWLRLVMRGWHKVVKSKVKWRSIQQVSKDSCCTAFSCAFSWCQAALFCMHALFKRFMS